MLSGTTAVVYWTDPTLPKGQVRIDGIQDVPDADAKLEPGDRLNPMSYQKSDKKHLSSVYLPYESTRQRLIVLVSI